DGRYCGSTVVAPSAVSGGIRVVVGAGAVPHSHETLRSFEMYGVSDSVLPVMLAFASLPYSIVMTPSATSTSVTYLPCVSVAVLVIPATIRLAGAAPRFRYVSATAAFAAAAMFMPSETCARIV